MGNAILDTIRDNAGNVLGYFINFGSELGAIEKVLIYMIAPAVGILISAWGVFDLMKLKNPRVQNKSSPGSVAIKFCTGPLTVQLAMTIQNMADSVFGENIVSTNEDLAASYVSSAQNAADPVKAGLLVGVAFLVVVGWIAGLRAMIAFSRIGSPGENGYHLFRAGASRLIAATAFCSIQFFLDDIAGSFTGQSGVFSSAIGL